MDASITPVLRHARRGRGAEPRKPAARRQLDRLHHKANRRLARDLREQRCHVTFDLLDASGVERPHVEREPPGVGRKADNAPSFPFTPNGNSDCRAAGNGGTGTMTLVVRGNAEPTTYSYTPVINGVAYDPDIIIEQ